MKKLLHWCSAALIAAVLLLPSSSLAQSQGPTFRSPTDQELAQTKNPGANWITYGGALAASHGDCRMDCNVPFDRGGASTPRPLLLPAGPPVSKAVA